jgi:hypothetical protein
VRIILTCIHTSTCPSIQAITQVEKNGIQGISSHSARNVRMKIKIGSKNNLLRGKISHSFRRGEKKERYKKFN